MAISLFDEYPSQVSTADPTGYPYGKPQNDFVVGDGNGTPYEQKVISDQHGLLQSLLVDAGETPSGTPDKVGASQYLDAIKIAARADMALANWRVDSVGNSYVDGLNGAVYSPPLGRYVFTGGVSGKTFYSDDAVGPFVELIATGASALHAVHWASIPAIFLAAGSGGKIFTCSDPAAGPWISRTAAAAFAGFFYGAASRGSTLVVGGFSVSTGGEIQYSTNGGATWTQASLPVANRVYNLVYCAALDMFFAACEAGVVLTSTDGATWAEATIASGYSGDYFALAVSEAHGEVLIGGSSGGHCEWTDDGVNFAPRINPFHSGGGPIPLVRCDALNRWIYVSGKEIWDTIDLQTWYVKTWDSSGGSSIINGCVGRNSVVLVGYGGKFEQSLRW